MAGARSTLAPVTVPPVVSGAHPTPADGTGRCGTSGAVNKHRAPALLATLPLSPAPTSAAPPHTPPATPPGVRSPTGARGSLVVLVGTVGCFGLLGAARCWGGGTRGARPGGRRGWAGGGDTGTENAPRSTPPPFTQPRRVTHTRVSPGWGVGGGVLFGDPAHRPRRGPVTAGVAPR